MAVVPTGAGFLVENVGVGLYRYGFNGKEKDTEGEWGSSTVYDYGFRVYDPGIAKFLSVDPLAPDYPMLTPYQFASNRPIDGIDLDGLEYFPVNLLDANGNIIGRRLDIKFKVINSSSLTDSEAKAYLPHIRKKVLSSYSNFEEGKASYTATISLTLVKNDEVNRDVDYYLELKNIPFGEDAVGRATSDHSAWIGVVMEVPTGYEETTTFTDAADGGLPIINTELTPTSDYVSIPGLEVGRTGAHEIGHVGGLEHPWTPMGLGRSENLPVLLRIQRSASLNINAGNENALSVKLILNNLMNTFDNPNANLQSNAGESLLRVQIAELFNNAIRRNQESNSDN